MYIQLGNLHQGKLGSFEISNEGFGFLPVLAVGGVAAFSKFKKDKKVKKRKKKQRHALATQQEEAAQKEKEAAMLVAPSGEFGPPQDMLGPPLAPPSGGGLPIIPIVLVGLVMVGGAVFFMMKR